MATILNVKLSQKTDGTWDLELPEVIPATITVPVRNAAALPDAILDKGLMWEADTGKLVLRYGSTLYDVTLTERV